MAPGRAISLFIFLGVVWMLLSGHWEPWLLGLGLTSVLCVVWLAYRMDVVDHEGHPVHLTWKIPLYWVWLGKEIVKSNLDVTRVILSRSARISPTVLRVKASQRTDLGLAIFANSITLTPGTVSLDVGDDYVLVHALTREAAEDLAGGAMDSRVAALEKAE